MAHSVGRWIIPDGSDLAIEQVHPILTANLCTTCGVRVWSSDMEIHDAWHDRLDAATTEAAQH